MTTLDVRGVTAITTINNIVTRTMSIIFSYVDDNTLPELINLTFSYKIITHLDNIYFTNHSSHLASLIESLITTKMHNKNNIHNHICLFDELVTQLKEFQFINKRYIS
jgi:gag-polypeptide of LTR copia-type